MQKTVNKLYQYKDGIVLGYQVFGSGPQTVVCFHGVGQDASVFYDLGCELVEYTTISIHLFYHANSQRVHPNKYLQHDEWAQLLYGLLEQEQVQTFSIVGYSMGGRYAISTLYAFPERVDHIVLLAPDGIVSPLWYRVATASVGFQRLFRYFMYHPKFFFKLLGVLEKAQWIPVSTMSFFRVLLKNKFALIQILHSWIMLKQLILPEKKISLLLNKKGTDSTLVFGSKDTVIRYHHHKDFVSRLTHSRVYVVDARHHEMIRATIDIVRTSLHGVGGIQKGD